MGKPPSRVAKFAAVAWKRLSDISTAAWLWSLLPSGVATVIVGWIAYGEGLPKSVVLLISVGVLAFVMILLAGFRIWRTVVAPAAVGLRIRPRIDTERSEPRGLGRIGGREPTSTPDVPQDWPGEPKGIPWPKAGTRKPQWISFQKALHYLVYDSRWAAAQPAVSNEEEFNKVVCAEVREHLARGEIAARGKRGWGDESLERATEEIPATFWVESYFQPWGEIALADDERGYACKRGGGGDKWSSVIVDEVAVRRVWPPRIFPPGADRAPTALSSAVEEMRGTCAKGNTEIREFESAKATKRAETEPLTDGPEPGPAFAPSLEFNYAYPKAVLRAELDRADGEKSARSGKVFHVGVRMNLISAHDKQLDDCSVVLAVIEHAGIETTVMEPMKFGNETSFTVYPHQTKAVSLLARDVSDPITPAPFLVKLASRELPLAENSRYVLTLELRSGYRFPTLVYVQIDTAGGTNLHVQIVKQVLSEKPL